MRKDRAVRTIIVLQVLHICASISAGVVTAEPSNVNVNNFSSQGPHRRIKQRHLSATDSTLASLTVSDEFYIDSLATCAF